MAYISIVTPVYKAANCIDELYHRLKVTLEKITCDFELILVEDCGLDGSWEKIVALAAHDQRVKGLQLSRNFGQHYAISAGLDHCKGEWVVVMDCDLQDDPQEILKLYQKAQEGYDVVLANRGKRNHTLYKRLLSWFFYKIFCYLSGLKYDGKIGNFRIISKKVVQNYQLMREQLRFFGGMINWLGFKTAIVDVKHIERYEGKSSYDFKKLTKLAVDTIIAYSDKPLRFVIKVGFLMSLLAFSFGIYIIYEKLINGSPVIGWSSLIVSIYFIGGMIISILGIIGIYLGKTFDEVKRRPLYIIADRVGQMNE